MDMSDVTQMLQSIEDGDAQAAEKLLPLVYEELRELAAARMAQEEPGHTLQATALVHEAYIRLVGTAKPQNWDSRGHFFAAASKAMRRILVDSARRKQSVRHGGQRGHFELSEEDVIAVPIADELLDLDEALSKLEEADPQLAQVISLRVFSGMSFDELAACLGISVRTAKRKWAFARAWLGREIGTQERTER